MRKAWERHVGGIGKALGMHEKNIGKAFGMHAKDIRKAWSEALGKHRADMKCTRKSSGTQ